MALAVIAHLIPKHALENAMESARRMHGGPTLESAAAAIMLRFDKNDRLS